MYTTIEHCRICGNENLEPIISLGVQALTGVFPRSRQEPVESGPLELVRCHGEGACGLVQLRHAFAPEKMYGDNYGYRSGLNRSMVKHLVSKAASLQNLVSIGWEDVILDIGSNDGTLLGGYAKDAAAYIGIDPSVKKFRRYYRDDIVAVPELFNDTVFFGLSGGRKAKIITSIAMFYDLETPQQFVNEVARSLHPDGVWHFEQSYLPLMLKVNAYDTICHEHSEYYALKQVKHMLDRANLEIVDVETNDVNGGSFAITAAHQGSGRQVSPRVGQMVAAEKQLGLDTSIPYSHFSERVKRHPDEMHQLFRNWRAEGKRILGYGASTKGNVILQYCGITANDLPAIAEVNEDKFGAFTPGTGIPIISEAEARSGRPDAFLVFPWHFKANFVERESSYLNAGGSFIFPLPELAVVTGA